MDLNAALLPPTARDAALDRLAAMPEPEVVILGGGVNGLGLLRDLALNGVSVALLETGDFCGGATGASSRMAHGGLRYLEGREFRLVAEATRERNRLLHDAPHLVRPLEIVVPLDHLVRGLGGSMARFFGLSRRPGPLSLAAFGGAVSLYEALGRVRRALPGPRILLSRKRFPRGFPRHVRAAASYYDGQIVGPEALALEMLDEALAAPRAVAANHVDWTAAPDGAILVRDAASGREATLRPRIVVNATGAGIDRANAALGIETRLVRGVKGAHLVLRHPELHARMAGRAFYFDDGAGRMVICLPVGNCVLMGTTEVETADPGDHGVAPAEIDYLLGAASRLFEDIPVTLAHVAAVTSGIRPLQAGGGSATQAARDHALVELETPGGLPVLALVGGKWTTFRSFSEQAADRALARLGRVRSATTADRSYPGAAAVDAAQVAAETGTPAERVAVLAARYGGLAAEVAAHCGAGEDAALRHAPDYSRREIGWLARRRMAMTLEDLVLRRTGLVLAGSVTPELLAELAAVMAEALGRDAGWRRAQVEACAADRRILFALPLREEVA